MKVLLTSNGISNPSIRAALVDLLGTSIEESTALVIPTAIYPFSVGPEMAFRMLHGNVSSPLVNLGWKTVGLLELTALPSIDPEVWQSVVRSADALLFWGGDPMYLSRWTRESGLADLLPTLDSVYVGVSAGAIAAATTFVETYTDPPSGMTGDEVVFATPDGDAHRLLVAGQGAGLVDFAVIPHYENPNHPDASTTNAAIWAAAIPAPTYALDDQSAVSVRDGVVEVVSEGAWKHFPGLHLP